MLTDLFYSRIARVLAFLLLSTLLLAGGLYLWFRWEVDKIERFAVPAPRPSLSAVTPGSNQPALAPAPDALRILVFSTGSSGLDDGDGERLGIGDGRAAMRDGLTDTVMLVSLRAGDGEIELLSIPRDLWLEERGHRINETYARHGVWSLVDDVEDLTGVRADHVVSLNFAAFADLTDAVGGVPVYFDHPARDLKAKLDIPEAGCVNLTGNDALAFVRSRHWQTQRDGVWRHDATSSDWGRIERQQAFLRLMSARLLDWKLPSRIPALLGVARDNLMFDANLTLSQLLSVATEFGRNGVAVSASTYPGRGGVTESGASVIFPDVTSGLALSEALFGSSAPTDTALPAPTGTPTTPMVGAPTTAPAPSLGGFTPARDGTGGTRYRGC
jgi:LCP family protein required for cell wall assembly